MVSKLQNGKHTMSLNVAREGSLAREGTWLVSYHMNRPIQDYITKFYFVI